MPRNLYRNLISPSINPAAYTLLFDFFYNKQPKLCDQILPSMPSLTFTFRNSGHQELVVTTEGSKLIIRDKQNETLCRCLLQEQLFENNFWQFGLTFLYQVYVELLLVDNRPFVKLYKKD